jgi:hypothetical protein
LASIGAVGALHHHLSNARAERERRISMLGFAASPRRSTLKFCALLLAATCVALSGPAAHAADQQWKVSGFVSGDWVDGGNWLGGSPPGTTSGTTNPDVATFQGGTNTSVTVDPNRNLYGINFIVASQYTLSGGDLVFTGAGPGWDNGIHADQAFQETINSPITLAPRTVGPDYYGMFGFATNGILNLGQITGAAGPGLFAHMVLDNTQNGPGTGRITGAISDGPNGGGVSVTAIVGGTSGGSGWTLSGNNTYTGNTNVAGINGTLTLRGSGAWGPALNGPGRCDIAGGAISFDYSNGSPDPVSTIATIIAAGAPSNFTSGQIYSDSSQTNSTTLGYVDNGSAVVVMYTLFGDANLDGTTDTVDFNIFAANFGFPNHASDLNAKDTPVDTWGKGDFNYDGTVDTVDFNLLAANFGKTIGASSPSLGTLIPEPASLSLLALTGLILRRRPRR